MKKTVIVLVSLLVALIVAIVGLEIYDAVQGYRVNSVTAQTVETQFDEENDFLLVVGTTTCSYCKTYKAGTLTDYLKTDPKDYPLYLVNSDENYGRMQNILNQTGEVTATPTTFLVIDGEVKGSIEGDISLDKLNQFIEDNE